MTRLLSNLAKEAGVNRLTVHLISSWTQRSKLTLLWLGLLAINLAILLPAAVTFAQTVSFGAATDFAVGSQPFSVAIGDLNGDGIPDLAVANHDSNTVSILLGTGPGAYSAATAFVVGFYPDSVAIGDLNGDGKPDLAVALDSSSTLSILFGDGTGAFGPATNLVVGDGPISVAIGDLNGDGKPDLAVAIFFNPSGVSILLGDGTGAFGPATNFAGGAGPYSVAIGDLNGDGKPDLAVADAGNSTVSILLGDGTGAFGPATSFAVGASPYAGPYTVAMGDLNSDGKPDLAVANGSNNTVSILLGDGTGAFGPATSFAGEGETRFVAMGDLNGDGKPDLAVANDSSNTVSILLGDGTGAFGPATSFPVGSYPIFVAVGDLNGDGKPDLATANGSSNTVSILLNTTTLPTINRAYVANTGSSTVSVIDTTTNTILDSVAVGSIPWGVAVNPAANRVYVTNRDSNTVSVIDTTTNTVVATVGVDVAPYGVAVDPAANRAYVANFVGHTVSVIDTTTNTVVASVPVADGPIGVAVNPAANRVYVVGYYYSTVSVIDTTTNTVVATVGVANYSGLVAVDPAANRVYVTNQEHNTVTVIDGMTNTVMAIVGTDSWPTGVAVDSAAHRAYVANTYSDTVSVIDTTTNTVVATVTVGDGPQGMALDATEHRAYVSNYFGNTVSVIDTTTNTVVGTATAGGGPVGVAVARFTSTLNTYVLTLTTAGTGSGSVTGAGTYSDGQTATVTATANAGSTFTGWTGTNGAECATGSVLMNANKSCTANFTLNTYTLTLTTAGSGSGTTSGGGTYNYNQTATVTATANAGSTFTGWTGANGAECATGSVLMNANKSCTANFAANIDLIISALSTATTAVAPGGTLSLSNTAKNQGTVSAGSFTIAFHLSSNTVYGDGDDIAFTAARSVSSLGAGASNTASTMLTVPSTTPLGGYYVCAMADRGNTVSEGNETNNTLCTAAPIQVTRPDLIMTAVTPNAGTVNAGAALSVTNTAKNQGLVSAGSSTIAFHLSTDTTYGNADDVVITTTRSVASLAVGASNTATSNLTIPTTTPTGNYYVCAKSDSANTVVETDESNNTLCSPGTVTVPPPDLVMTAVSTTTTAVAPGKTLSLSNTVKNQGGSKAGAFTIGFHLSTNTTYGDVDDVAMTATRSLTSLAVGASSTVLTTLTVPATTPLGTYYVCAMADSGGTVAESNEGNNTFCTTATIQVTRPDLMMTAVTPNAATVNRGSTLSVTNAVMNQGLVSSTSFRIGFRLSVNNVYGDADDVVIPTIRSVTSLAAGVSSSATISLSISSTTPPGVYNVCALADSLNAVVETDEGNNTICSNSAVTVQ